MLSKPSKEHLVEPETLLEKLYERGEQHFDPARIAYIESLLRRASTHTVSVAQGVRARASDALKEYCIDFSEAQAIAAEVLREAIQLYPESRLKLQQLFDSCNFTQLKRELFALDRGKVTASLVELAEFVSQPSVSVEEQNREPSFDDILRQHERNLVNPNAGRPDKEKNSPGHNEDSHRESDTNSMHYFRESLVKRNADKLVTRLVREIPEGVGPLNPEKLIVQSLASMRDLSPHYLNRFVAYIDTLLWLEKAGK